MHKKKQYKLVILVRTSVHIAQLILFFCPFFITRPRKRWSHLLVSVPDTPAYIS